MPSYVIHYICGNKLIEKYKVSPKEKAMFLVGNLIPDSSKVLGNIETASLPGDFRKRHRKEIQQEKLLTHFRDEKDLDNVIMLPYPERFKEKYDIKDLVSLGYYYHLCTDKYFFSEIWKKSFIFLNDKYEETSSKKEAKYVQIKKNNKIIPIEDFYSSKHLYHDYTIMNRILLDCFNISFDSEELIKYLDGIKNYIEEVDINNLASVIKDTLFYISESNRIDEEELEVFDKEIIINFINELNKKFTENNQPILKKIGLKKC